MGKVSSPVGAATYGTLEEFVAAVEARPDVDWRRYIRWVMQNADVSSRLGIANWMLDQGMDLSRPLDSDKVNALHVLFGQRDHDIPDEARLVQRMLDAGADIYLRSSRWGVPLWNLATNPYFEDAEMGPMYDVIFSVPGIDWDVVVSGGKENPLSLRGYFERIQKGFPELYRRMCVYLESGPSPRPVFD